MSTREELESALESGGANGKLRLSIVLEGDAAEVVREELGSFGINPGGYRAFLRRAIKAEMERLYDERDAKAEAAKAVKAAQAAVQPKKETAKAAA